MQESNERKAEKVYKIIMLVILTVFITFIVTSLSLYTYFKRNPAYALATGENKNTSSEIDIYLNKVRTVIDHNYLWNDKIDNQKLKDAAIQGYVKGLGDKYTEYIPASEMKDFTEEITGNFTGIGIYMIADEDSKKIIVYYPIPGSPAEKAGLKSGDAIISVDGVEYGYDDFNIIADKIKGKEGTKVKLVVEREEKKLDFEITRSKIEINPINAKILDNNIGYLNFPSFDDKSAKRFKEKADELISKGAKSLIIDLRNNGGGIVNESTKIADYFLDKGKTIITTKDNNNNQEVTTAKDSKTYNIPVVVLVNENTASAAEILTGALKDNKVATVIGKTTYGKGVIQTVITLTDGSGLKITTAEYFTPSGTSINEIGIKPDIEVKLPNTLKSVYAVKEADDTQLKRAIEELSK